MSKENPFNKASEEKKDESIAGDGFVMRKSEKFGHSSGTPVEFRPGESTDVARERKKQEEEQWKQKEDERTRDFTPADHVKYILDRMLKTHNQYSETFRIRPDGTFDKILRLDNQPVYMEIANTPDELYQFARDIENKHPEYHFSFEIDPEGKWMKYTVSKDKGGK